MRSEILCLLVIASLWGTPAVAQDDLGMSEIIVTGSRISADGYNERVPAIGLRRRADFAVQEVTIAGDTRDADKRHDEMYRMIHGAIELAGRQGVQLATGEMVVEPLTLANYRDLTFTKGDRPDTDRVSFLVKTPLAGGVDAKVALERIDRFIKNVPAVGRALINTTDDLTLSVVKPDQYRSEIAELISSDSRALAARFGPTYAVEARGLNRPVEWSRAGLTDVLLYIPYDMTIVPRP